MKITSMAKSEIGKMKQDINLTMYAATVGYIIDRRASSNNSITMTGPNGDKIIVAKGQDGHWVYFSVRDQADHGSIIDFIQNRDGGNIGQVREKLRPWLSGEAVPKPAVDVSADAYAAWVKPTERNQVKIEADYAMMQELQGHHDYLERDRCIPPHFLTDPRFADRVRVDHYGNAIFPHYNDDGLCGYEIKNTGFTGFAKGGAKGLWSSKPGSYGQDDRVLVVAETAIDALSYAALHKTPAARYVSTAGQISPGQRTLLVNAFESLPDDGRVILALDYDAAGVDMAKQIEDLFLFIDRKDRDLTLDHPPTFGQDWNDVLKNSSGTADRPAAPLNPRPNKHPTHHLWM